MQDRYTGDVGDFGKYGLLRALCAADTHSHLKLGVVWYLVPDESHNDDGKHVNYLRNAVNAYARGLRDCDPDLYDGLRRLLIDEKDEIVTARRLVTTIERSGLLPLGTVFYNAVLSYVKQMKTTDRHRIRRTWLDGALRATASADLVFLDPDMGIECRSVGRTNAKGPKYVYWDDITSFLDRGQSVIVYHHFNHSCSSTKQVEQLLAEFDQRIPKGFTTSNIIYRRGTRRAYFIVTTTEHRDDIANRLFKVSTRWEDHFVNQ